VQRAALAATAAFVEWLLLQLKACVVHCYYVQVEIKTTPATPDSGNLQRAADFIHAYILGFEVQVSARFE
jgi:rRNA processing protein Krr1/Pno1